MKYLISFALFLTLLACGSKPSAQTKSNVDMTTQDIVKPFSFDTDKLDTYLNTLYTNNKWQGSVAVLHEGKPIYLRTHGQLSSESKRKADNGSRYRIGSIAKTYTSALIHDLIAKGELGYNTTLDHFFEDIPNAKKITIDHLLTHKSGLANYTDDPDFDVTSFKTEDQILDFVQNMKPNRQPGQKYEYSNTNYYLLARIIEKESGNSYKEQVENEILAPRKLISTKVGDEEVLATQNEASSFIFDHEINDWAQVPAWSLSNALGAGDISATAKDVASFYNELFRPSFFPENILENMIDVDKNGKGRGLFILPFGDKKSYGHTGGLEGYRSMASYFPEEKISWAILSNGVNTNLNDIAIGILSIVYDKGFEIPNFDEPIQKVENIAAYIGEFISDEIPLGIKFFEKDGQLFSQATGQSSFPLTENGDGVFEYAPAGIKVTFKNIEENQYQNFTLFQGKSFEFKRK